MKVLIKNTALCFALLGILFIPFPFVFFPYQTTISEGLFGPFIHFIIEKILGIEQYFHQIVSDSLMLYVLALLLIFLALLLAISTYYLPTKFVNKQKFISFCQPFFSYYLALMLIKYGFDKLFLRQFYVPEPNILYTPLGFLDKDILFWSTMGTSFGYNIFMGLAEIITAILLLFNKTRIVGALFSCALFINIVAINFSFDISVKLYSVFLLFLSILVLRPFLYQLFSFLILKIPSQLSKDRNVFFLFKPSFTKTFVKTFVILLIFTEGILPNLQDQPLPYLHGAYQVTNVIQNNKKQDLNSIPFKRIFIHKDHYLIFQNHDEQMDDYKMSINTLNNQIILTDYSLRQDTLAYQYSSNDSSLILQYYKKNKLLTVTSQQLSLENMPIQKKHFHWMID